VVPVAYPLSGALVLGQEDGAESWVGEKESGQRSLGLPRRAFARVCEIEERPCSMAMLHALAPCSGWQIGNWRPCALPVKSPDLDSKNLASPACLTFERQGSLRRWVVAEIRHGRGRGHA
jgi:hypothetical protein